MRDKLIHNYMGVDLDAVWKTIEDIIPPMRKKLTEVVDSIGEGDSENL